MKQNVHENSIATYNQELVKLSIRAAKIYEFMLKVHSPMTDREVQAAMKFAERGQVQPRITELVKAKLLSEVDKVPCKITGKAVRRVMASVHVMTTEDDGQGLLFSSSVQDRKTEGAE